MMNDTAKARAIAKSNHIFRAEQRATRARAILADLLVARPEHRAQLIDNWLFFATSAEVRREWRSWMGPMPGWASR